MEKTKYSLNQIREFWINQAKQHGGSHAASWSDKPAIELEVNEIIKYLDDGDFVLDIGCANGYSTIQYASQKKIKICGLDYTSEMIQSAKKQIAHMLPKLRGDVGFEIGNILAIKASDNSFDKVISTRVVINLGKWEDQLIGLKECVRVLKQGGILLLSEPTMQGWKTINKLRMEWDLPAIPMPPFNNYLDEQRVIESLKPDLVLQELVNFSSTYFIGTRFLKPLLINALSLKIDNADPNMEWNNLFSKLPAWGNYGMQKLFVFKKTV